MNSVLVNCFGQSCPGKVWLTDRSNIFKLIPQRFTEDFKQETNQTNKTSHKSIVIWHLPRSTGCFIICVATVSLKMQKYIKDLHSLVADIPKF